MPGNVRRVHYCKLLPWNPAAEMDTDDTAAWRLAAHGGAVQHAGKCQVIDVHGGAAHLGTAVFTRDRCAHKRIHRYLSCCQLSWHAESLAATLARWAALAAPEYCPDGGSALGVEDLPNPGNADLAFR